MKKAFAYMMLALITASSLQQLGVLGMYWFSQDYITEKFCVNKDKPELKCKGKCHMADMMADNSEKESKAVSHVENVLPVYFTELSVDVPSPLILQSFTEEPRELCLTDAYYDTPFQPPEFLS